MDEGFITLAVKSNIMHCYFDIEKSYDEMFEKVEKSYADAAKLIGADKIIPCGRAMKNALDLGIKKVHRDTFHASLGLGRFILALTWYKALTGNSIDNVKFNDFDEPVSEKDASMAQRCAQRAVEEIRSLMKCINSITKKEK